MWWEGKHTLYFKNDEESNQMNITYTSIFKIYEIKLSPLSVAPWQEFQLDTCWCIASPGNTEGFWNNSIILQ